MCYPCYHLSHVNTAGVQSLFRSPYLVAIPFHRAGVSEFGDGWNNQGEYEFLLPSSGKAFPNQNTTDAQNKFF